jgi:hypothetical protein
MMKDIMLGCPRPVRDIIRDTILHGFENPLLSTAGERYKEGRRGCTKGGSKSLLGNVGYEMI